MANFGEITVTILDMPEIREIIQELMMAVPSWEREQLNERLQVVLARATKNAAERERKAREKLR